MRPGIIIVCLIVVGGIVIVAPIIAEYRLKSDHQSNIVRLLEKTGAGTVTLAHEEMSTALEVGCWFTGTVMVVAGIVLTIREQRAMARRFEQSEHPPTSHVPSRATGADVENTGIQRRSAL